MGTVDYESIKMNRDGWEALKRRLGETTEIVRMGSVQLHAGDQIVYVPTHLQLISPHEPATRGYFTTDLSAQGIEFGFMTSVSPDDVHAWCRFWRPGLPVGELRTKANSERCEVADLVLYVSVADWIVQEAMDRWCR